MDANHSKLKSFIPVSNQSPFPIQNLPLGVFQKKGQNPRCGCAIGDYVLDLSILEEEGFFEFNNRIFASHSLNAFMRLGSKVWKQTREKISFLLRHDTPMLRDNKNLFEKCFIKQNEVEMRLPVEIGDYTDFYSSKEHATNIGLMIRDPKNPLLPNWKHLPVAYHGRASSIVVSGTPVRRPWGQILDGENPIFSPSKRLDFELELAFLIGKDSEQGHPVSVEDADDYIFGFVLMNDWSARDIQRWEYLPLGPFVSKSFSTSISAWVVLADALKPFRTEGPKQELVPFSYLQDKNEKSHYDINLEVVLKTAEQSDEFILSRGNAKSIYWSTNQQLAHHTITGCNLKVGDLMASGTISGGDKSALGSLMEMSWNGTQPVSVGRENRSFLQDKDQITLKAYCQGDGYRIGFGNVQGEILPPLNMN